MDKQQYQMIPNCVPEFLFSGKVQIIIEQQDSVPVCKVSYLCQHLTQDGELAAAAGLGALSILAVVGEMLAILAL